MPYIKYEWNAHGNHPDQMEWKIDWSLRGDNHEVMCQSNQGFRDLWAAQRSVSAVHQAFGGTLDFKSPGPMPTEPPGRPFADPLCGIENNN